MNLDTQLAQLDAQQIIRRVDALELEYMFKHALTQETTYASLLKKTRRDIHARVAQTFEQEYPDRLDEFAALLATHYAEAGDDAKTIVYATRAGDANARVYANAEAVAHYSIAIEAAKRAGTLLGDLGVKRGRALELLGRYQDALANYVEMESLARAQKDPALEMASLIARATLFSTHTPLYDNQRAQEFTHQALAYARTIGDRLAEAKILWTQMLFQIYGTGNPEVGVDYGGQSLKILRELSAQPAFAQDRAVREQLAYTLNDLLYAYIQLGKLDLGLAARQEARDLWQELDNKPMLADNLAGVALAQLTFGDAEQGMATADEGYAIAESISNPWSMAQGRTMRGYALLELGRFSEALRALHQGDEFATAAETGGAMIASGCALATHYGKLGMVERGLELGQRALDGAQRYIPDWHLWPHAALVRLHLARGDLAAAQRLADESNLESPQRKLFKAFMPGVATVVLADAELAFAKKNYARVLTLAAEANDYFSGSAPNYLPDLFLLRAAALQAQGNRDHALRVMREASARAKKSRRIRWNVLGAASALERANGNGSEADRLRAAARAEMEFIAQNLEDNPATLLGTGLRGSFLNLPDVRAVIG